MLKVKKRSEKAFDNQNAFDEKNNSLVLLTTYSVFIYIEMIFINLYNNNNNQFNLLLNFSIVNNFSSSRKSMCRTKE